MFTDLLKFTYLLYSQAINPSDVYGGVSRPLVYKNTGKCYFTEPSDYGSKHALYGKQNVEADYILFIDDDMICPPDLFERLYKHQKDIVAALAFTRYPPHKPVIYKLTKGGGINGKRITLAKRFIFCNH